MIEETNISRETVIYNLKLLVERCLGRKPFKRTMWRSGRFIEVETTEFHPGTVLRGVELLGREIGMFKERHESKVTLSDEELEVELRRLLAELDLSAPPAKEGKLDA
jgi:hypothetical protein